MTLTQRDQRILIFLIPIVVLVGYWFLLLSPKRDDLAEAKTARDQMVQRRDTAVARVAQLERARQTFASDFAAVVRLGKAVPSFVDAPSLLLQLDQAADGTAIDFNSVNFGARETGITAPAVPAAEQPAAGGQPAGNAAAGGIAAATGPGQAVEAAGEAGTTQEGQQAASQTAQAGAEGTTPPAGGAPAPAEGQAPASQTPPATLDRIPLTFDFRGSYFDLADFFHRLKRFVYVSDDRIFIRGRLLTIDSLSFAPGGAGAGSNTADPLDPSSLTANVGATVYISSRATGGATAGATPAGPAPGAPAATPPAGETARRESSPTAVIRGVR